MVKNTLIWLCCAWLLGACNKENAPDCLQKAGTLTAELRALPAFQAIHVRDYFTSVTLVQSSDYWVEVEGGKNLLPDIVTTVDNQGVLLLRNDNGCNFVRSFKHSLRLTIGCPDLKVITLFEGAGDFRIPGPFAVDTLGIEGHDFVGLLEANLTVRTVSAALHAGLGDVRLSGTTDDLYLYNLGYGFADARGVEAGRVFANNGSTNRMDVRAGQYLFATITGRGNIYVHGQPAGYDALLPGEGALVFLP